MIVVFCSPEDIDSLWLASEINRTGGNAKVVLPEELISGSDLRLDIMNGRATPFARLASGLELNVSDVRALIVRMTEFPSPDLGKASDQDVIYANEEMRAALVGWFAAWPCPVVGRPAPYCAFGEGSSDLRWRMWAARSGVPALDTQIGTDLTASEPTDQLELLVVGGVPFGRVEDTGVTTLTPACRVLASLQDAPMFGARFARQHGAYVFAGMIPFPAYRDYTQEFVTEFISQSGVL